MKLEALHEFATLVKHHSFTMAAKELYLSQPSLSTHIDLLEKELGFGLLQRSGNGFNVTPAGLAFLDYSQKILALYKDALADCGTIARGTQPARIQNISTNSHVFKLLSGIKNQMFSLCDLDLEMSALTALERGIIDIGMGYDFSKIPELKQLYEDEGVGYFGLGKGRMALSMMKTHPLAQKTELTREDLQGATVVINSGAHFDSHQLIISRILGSDINLRFKLSPVSCFANLAFVDYGDSIHICGYEFEIERFSHRDDMVVFDKLDGKDLLLDEGFIYLLSNKRAIDFINNLPNNLPKLLT